MKSNKIIALLLALVMMLTLFAGCTDSDSNDPTSATDENSEYISEDTNTPDEEPETKEPENETPTNNSSKPLSRGTINGNVYTNEFADITFTKHKDWTYKSNEEIAELIGYSSDLLDYDLEEIVAKSGTYIDMMVTFPTGSPNLQVTVEDLNFQSISYLTPEKYLELSRQQMLAMNPTYTFGDIYEKELCGHTYTVMDLEGVYGTTKTLQRLYLRKQGNYMISITMSATTENSFETMENMFS